MIKVAVPQLGETVAPRFEAARKFVIATIDDDKKISTQDVECVGPEGYRRVRMIQIHSVEVLICNGIKGAYRDMLTASGVSVIADVSAGATEALNWFIEGRLTPTSPTNSESTETCTIPHNQMVERARELFEKNGYTVNPGPGQDSFLVDLVAEITCPVCDRPVRVAICCAAHMYRPDLEISEFYQAASSNYNARVYVSPAQPSVVRFCREYNLELIDPNQESSERDGADSGRIPLLRGPVIGHKLASGPVWE